MITKPVSIEDRVAEHLAKARATDQMRGNLDHAIAKEWITAKQCELYGCESWLVPHPQAITYVYSLLTSNRWMSKCGAVFKVSPQELRSIGSIGGPDSWWKLNNYADFNDRFCTFVYALYVCSLITDPKVIWDLVRNALFRLRGDVLACFVIQDWHSMMGRAFVKIFHKFSNTGEDLQQLFVDTMSDHDTFDARSNKNIRVTDQAERFLAKSYKQGGHSGRTSRHPSPETRPRNESGWGSMSADMLPRGRGKNRNRDRSERDRSRGRMPEFGGRNRTKERSRSRSRGKSKLEKVAGFTSEVQ